MVLNPFTVPVAMRKASVFRGRPRDAAALARVFRFETAAGIGDSGLH